MRKALLPLLLIPSLAWAQDAPAPEPPAPESPGPESPAPAIEAVISDQLSDFTARDVPGAWEHASPMIQELFGSPENFGRMVREGYPMVWDNGDVDFLELREVDGALRQGVEMRDPLGQRWRLDYDMVELDGAWRINGVQVRPAPEFLY